MNAIRAVVRGGRIETVEPLDLPDGTELRIPLPAPIDDMEEGWDTSPEAIAAWIERDKAAEPPNFDLAEWEAAMKWLKESYGLKSFSLPSSSFTRFSSSQNRCNVGSSQESPLDGSDAMNP